MSRQELADAINVYLAGRSSRIIDANHIGKLERGEHRWPNREYREAFRAVLNAATDEELGFYIVRGHRVGSVGSRRDGDVVMAPLLRGHGGLTRLTGAAWFGMLPTELIEMPGPWATAMDVPTKIEPAHLDALQRSIALFEQWDHQYGGGLVRAAMGGQLEWACRAARQSTMADVVKRAWHSTTARLGDLAGWACFDAGDRPELAQHYFLTAIQLSSEAEDVQQRAHTATSMSRYLTYHGKTTEALDIIDLARLAWRELPPLGRAVIGIVEARVHAKIGDGQACQRAVDLCDSNYAASLAEGAQDPTWGYYADAGQILGDAGHALFDLAMTSGDQDQAEVTINRLESAYAQHADDTFRSKALTMIRVACLKTHQRDIDGALDAAEQGTDNARHVRSHRLIDDLSRLDALLQQAQNRANAGERLVALRANIAELIKVGV